MKAKANHRSFIKVIMSGMVVLFASSILSAQVEQLVSYSNFKIVIEKTDVGIKMHCPKGSAWVDLAFSLHGENPQAVDEYGMTKIEEVSQREDSKYANYLFTITKTETAFVLKGLEGTDWTDLRLSLADKIHIIDKFGKTTNDGN